MAKRTIVIDFETATDDDWQRAAEALAAVEAGMPVWEALGEAPPPEPTPISQLDPKSPLAQHMALVMGMGESD